ncbi:MULTISPECIES: acyl-CoA thioesterase [Myroides]|uniref:Thioesterase n=1 Tax=Myroides albus TaxID=2562892 RepID=A0A6I3LHE5_9FLAO|nr:MULTISPECIES: thioesterase family protein [Myroides]MTG96996.1 thioesterase [Myroides albus]MVX34463.1 thioesterase [Myroides sp. LoEW2-1]UVD80513.1 thioesterase family protein [Myroides albus]
MSRIKITMPTDYTYKVSIPVRITDLNYGNHLGNDKLLSILHEARVMFLNHFGYTEMDCAGVGLIMADVAIEYKNEAFYGDVLSIQLVAGDFSRVGFDLYYLVQTETKVIAKAKTGMVTFNYQSKSVVAVPEILLSQFVSQNI